jgi:hypothetical protein
VSKAQGEGTHMRRTIGTLAIALVVSTALAGSSSTFASTEHGRTTPLTDLAVVSEDPYTNIKTFHRTEVEPDSFASGSTIVSTMQAGRSYRCGASNLGWSVSSDGGSSWSGGFLPGTTTHARPRGTWLRVSDPVVARDTKHGVWLVQGIGIRTCPFAGGPIFVSRSMDGGVSFGDPVVVQHQKPSQVFDKPWLACDNAPASPFFGHCYATWDDAGHGFRLHMSTSTDGGATWHKATLRKDTHAAGGQPVIQPNGTVVVPIIQCCPNRIDSFISRDGGLTYHGHGTDYSGPLAIHNVQASRVHGHLRVPTEPLLPSADVDAAGRIYVAWYDCRFRHRDDPCAQNDIVMSRTNDGRHWSPVIRIPIDRRRSSADHFLAAVAVDPSTARRSAHLGVAYYFYPDADCTPKTCDLMVGFASSGDGGDTWTSQDLAGPFKTTWLPLTIQGYMVGDYISVSFSGGDAVAVFAAASEGTCDLGEVTSCDVWTASATIPVP